MKYCTSEMKMTGCFHKLLLGAWYHPPGPPWSPWSDLPFLLVSSLFALPLLVWLWPVECCCLCVPEVKCFPGLRPGCLHLKFIVDYSPVQSWAGYSPAMQFSLVDARSLPCTWYTKALVISWFLFVLGLSFASFAQTPAAVRSLRGEKCKKHEEREECCVDEPASPCITHPQESTTDCSCSSLENTLVTSVCKEIKTNKYMFYDVICLCWVFDILLKWPYRWATTLGQTWNHRLHFLKTDTAFLETVTGDPWVPLLWGRSKPPCVYDLHSELERARLFGESGLVKTLLNTNYVLVKLTCCAVLWDGG